MHSTTYKALCPGIPVTDTIKEIKNGTVEKTLIRQNLVAIQIATAVFHVKYYWMPMIK